MPPRKKQRGDSSSHAPAAAAIAALPPPPQTRLYAVTRQCICAFLSFNDLRAVVLTCRDWRHAVATAQPIAEGMEVRSKQQLEGALAAASSSSPLLRHISRVGVEDVYPALMLSPAHVQQLALRMPSLQAIFFAPTQSADWPDTRFPPSLVELSCVTRLEVRVGDGEDDTNLVAVLSAAATHAPRVEKVTLIAMYGTAVVSLAPLQHMRALKALLLSRICVEPVSDLALTQAEFIKWHCEEEDLLELLQSPCARQLQWKKLPEKTPHPFRNDCLQIVSDEVANLLPLLPRLEHFDTQCCTDDISSFDFLANLPALTSLKVDAPKRWRMGGAVHALARARIDARLSELSCTLQRVTTCDLHSGLDTPQLRALMARMPRLVDLTLSMTNHFDSLTFLEPVRASLRRLTIQYCDGEEFAPASLLELGSFGLTHLSVKNSLNAPLDALHLWALTPPSALVPTLQQFVYKTPAEYRRTEEEDA
jgi:hypothetical protein